MTRHAQFDEAILPFSISTSTTSSSALSDLATFLKVACSPRRTVPVPLPHRPTSPSHSVSLKLPSRPLILLDDGSTSSSPEPKPPVHHTLPPEPLIHLAPPFEPPQLTPSALVPQTGPTWSFLSHDYSSSCWCL